MAGGLVVAVALGCGVVRKVVSMVLFSGVLVYCGVVGQGSADDEMNSDDSDSEKCSVETSLQVSSS